MLAEDDILHLTALTADAFSMTDPEEYPEASACLSTILRLADGSGAEPYEIANRILRCDRPGELPDHLIVYVTELFELAFQAGNPEAMNDLGAQYYDGNRGFPEDEEKAVACYKLAAENGSRQAQENLGYCYYYGRAGDRDYEKAFQYFALGAFDGHAVSLYKIGDMYRNGYYVQKNEREAFAIYLHCAKTMTDEDAERAAGPVYLRLGDMFLHGTGTEQDARAALMCYQKAELYLYDMAANGEYMYYDSLRKAIRMQSEARSVMSAAIPEDQRF